MVNKLKNSAKFKNRVHKTISVSKSLIFNVCLFIILVGISYVILSPIIGIISDSFMDMRDVYDPLVYLIPRIGSLNNYVLAFENSSFATVFPETMLYITVLTLLQIFVTSLVGYGFARFRFPGRGVWFGLVIVTIVVPPQTLMISMYQQFRYFDFFGLFRLLNMPTISLINTYTPMVMMTALGNGLKSGLYIFIFRQFFRGLPKEIEEAALIDGAGTIRTYLSVMLPNAVPAIITVAMFSYVWQYNDTFYSVTFMNQKSLIAVKLATAGNTFAKGANINDPNYIKLVTSAAIVLGIAPIITIYLALQKFFMEGIERSGIVG